MNKKSIHISNLPFIEELYAQHIKDPNTIDPSWSAFFKSVDYPQESTVESRMRDTAPADLRIDHLIAAYRTYGHLLAQVNPIATHEIKEPYQLNLNYLGFNESELASLFPTCKLMPENKAPLSTILETLKTIYSGRIGIEYMSTLNPELEKWLQEKIEPTCSQPNLSIDQKKMILQHLNKSELFEVFLHTKYTGQKRFSLEGGETLIPMLAAVLETGSSLGLESFVIGMAHRGRLNVLSNIMEKSYTDIFHEFEEGYVPDSFEGSGDVKYHKGFSSTVNLSEGQKLNIFLSPNPSHLEAVDPVVEGQVFARQVSEKTKEQTIPILIHGDAAIAGQGVVYETLQLQHLRGYSTGGTLHFVINNQIGFTTLPFDSRSTHYCTGIARSFHAPVFHVNAEDPESCVYAVNLAIKLRQKFHCDVFIDLNCYRKYGHNETDEPAFTQPLEYQLIRKKKPIRELYRDDLIQQGILERKMAEELEEEFKKALYYALEKIKIPKKPHIEKEKEKISIFQPVATTVSLQVLQEIAQKLSQIPDDFKLHKKLKRLINDRLAMIMENKAIDWGMGETLALATLLWGKKDIRLSGQDTCRGTFSHRHALWMDQEEEGAYYPLNHLKKTQGIFQVINSPLSEYASLGFEFGYSTASPETLVIWEAQFGDFTNGAQVIIDQFIATGEQKWGQQSGLVMLLPHGYEGQGPEHSSARMERFLSLCGNENLIVVNPTLPAQLFHLLRRQGIGPVQKPLIVFTPKGLLRHSECTSQVSDFTEGRFEEILDDPRRPTEAKRLILCSGRFYYDLVEKCTDNEAIIRIEQLYPLNVEKLKTTARRYRHIEKIYWVQEEHSNMGAWDFIRPELREIFPHHLEPEYIGRARSASPATGSFAMHKKQHSAILDQLFGAVS